MRGVIGNLQAQPRVFAHSAASIVIGAVNTTWKDGGVSALISGGTGYAVASGVATTSSGAGVGLTVNILAVDAGVITSFEVAAVGSGYAVGETITISGGGGNATFTVTNIDIPNTAERGCCIYVGTTGNVSLVLEGDTNAITFSNVQQGSFLPVLAVRVTAGSDLIALY